MSIPHFLLLLSGQQTESDLVQQLLAQAGGVGMWHKFNAAAFQSTGLPISYNAAYTGGAGSEIIGDPEFNGGGWWGEIESGSNTAVISGGIATLTRVDSTVGLDRTSLFTIGATYRVSHKINGQTGNYRDTTHNGSPVHVERVSSGNVTLQYDRFASCVADVTRADDLFLFQINAGITELDHYRAYLVSDYDLQCSSSGVTAGQSDHNSIANEAFDLNGTNNQLFTQRTTLNGLTDLFYQIVINLDTITANDSLLFKNASLDLHLNSGGTLTFTVNYASTNATLTTNETLSTGTWYTIAVKIGADKVPHLFIDGIEATYSAQTTGVGTRASNSNPLYCLSHSTASQSMDGKVSDLKLFATNPSDDVVRLLHSMIGT